MTLVAEDVRVALGGRAVLDGVSLSAGAGEVVAVVGPNGAGKSTLLRALAGVVPLAGGRVTLDGREPARGERARRVAYLPQSAGDLPADLTVGELVLLGRVPHLGPFGLDGARDVARARAAAERLGVLDLWPRRAAELSGGQRQRARLARCLAQGAAALLLDEPDTFLDLRRRAELAGLLRALAADGLAVVAALHDLEFAASVATRVVLLADGRVLAHGSPREVLTATNVERAYGVAVDVRGEGDALVVRPRPV